ncbi:kinase-like domain-containing protein, partial [Triangularia verruculosa]
GLTDNHLPLRYDQDRNVFVSDARIIGGVKRDKAEFTPFLSAVTDCARFARDWQHQFCIPVFGNAEYSELDARCILPIFRLGGRSESGSYGVVDQVRIHPAHLKPENNVVSQVECLNVLTDQIMKMSEKDNKFALKKLIAESEDEFNREREALAKIQSLGHDHLINLTASFRRGQFEFYFVFPWAEGGDLRHFWEQPTSQFGEHVSTWALGQMYGVAEAIKKMHMPLNSYEGTEEYGRHGDLRPENILVFRSDGDSSIGKLRITDAGLARFHQKITNERTAGTTTTSGSIEYAPPESLEEGEGVKRSQKYDMWSLGCIFLEFVIWVVEGRTGVTEFRRERLQKKSNVNQPCDVYDPYYLVQDGNTAMENYVVHPKVIGRILSIKRDPRYVRQLRELVHIVEIGLLVADIEHRLDAKSLVNEFESRMGIERPQVASSQLQFVRGSGIAARVNSPEHETGNDASYRRQEVLVPSGTGEKKGRKPRWPSRYLGIGSS